MVNLTIDHKKITVPEGTTLMEAAKMNGIPIPRLCFLKGINEIGACRVCVVEQEGKERLITSCNNQVVENMVIYTNSPKVRMNRKKTVELLLSQHDCRCATCMRSGNCALQEIANDLNILEIPFQTELDRAEWNKKFPLIRDSSKCIKCMRCIQVCDKIQSVHVWDVEGTGSRTTVQVSHHRKIEDSDCTLCGQCITHCPVGALRERDDTDDAFDAFADEKKITVVQIAPAVRTAWGENIGLKREDASVEKIADALKKMGADYVFDTTFSADLTIMEEANEFLSRLEKGDLKEQPMFTSCCPGWVRFIKSQYPHLVKQLSTAKSPQQMFGAVMKSYFAKEIGVKPENIYTISVMPCLAKKGEERNVGLYYGEYAGYDIDCVLTTRELSRMIRASHIDPSTLQEIPFDSIMQHGSGAGVIFGATGGVMEAALRTAYYKLTGENPGADAFQSVRRQGEMEGVREADITIGKTRIHTAVVSGLANTRAFLDRMEREELKYDFVEVMACPGGCVGGGGQPIHDGEELAYERGKKLYYLDAHAKIRFSHENPDILRLYEKYMEHPLSNTAHQLLHTDHFAWEMPKK